MKTKEDRVQHALEGCLMIGERRTIIHDVDGDVFGFGELGQGSLTIVCAYDDPANDVQIEHITIGSPVFQQLLEWLESNTSSCSTCQADEWIKRGFVRVCLKCAIDTAKRDEIRRVYDRWRGLSLGVLPDASPIVQFTRWLESEMTVRLPPTAKTESKS